MNHRNDKIAQLEKQIDTFKDELSSLRDPEPEVPSKPWTKRRSAAMALFCLVMVLIGCVLWGDVMNSKADVFGFDFMRKVFLVLLMVGAVVGALDAGLQAWLLHRRQNEGKE